jgi:SAM-dependent methyltransferase
MSLKEDDEMRDNVRAFVAAAAESFSLPVPVYEFGSYIVPGQESIGDLRPLFAGREYVGCDMREGPGVDQVEDISRLSMAEESVPSIVCVETLEHVFEVRRAVDEIIRVLAPGGIVLIYTTTRATTGGSLPPASTGCWRRWGRSPSVGKGSRASRTRCSPWAAKHRSPRRSPRASADSRPRWNAD